MTRADGCEGFVDGVLRVDAGSERAQVDCVLEAAKIGLSLFFFLAVLQKRLVESVNGEDHDLW